MVPSFTENLRYVDSLSLLYVGLAISLALLVLPAISMGLYWWWEARKQSHAVEAVEERREELAEERRRAA